MSGNLERRYRRVLRLLPGWYRERWEQDMVAAFLDSWLTGDPEADEYITRAAGPSWAEAASVARLAVRLHLGGAGTARRFAWGQAIRCAVLAVTLVQAVRGLDVLVQTAWSRDLLSWLPAPPASLVPGPFSSGIVPTVVWYLMACAWIAAFVTLVLGHYRIARVIAAPAVVPYLIWVLQGQFTDRFPATPIGPWAFWILLNLAPVLAMTAFHRNAPPPARRPWLLALPVGYLLVVVPLLALQATGNFTWIPDFSGLCCILVALACLAHAPWAWSRRSAAGRMVADPGPAGRGRRGVPDLLDRRLPAGPAPDRGEPGGTAHPGGRGRAGRPGRGPRPGRGARTAAVSAAGMRKRGLRREVPGDEVPAPAEPIARTGQRAGFRPRADYRRLQSPGPDRARPQPWRSSAPGPGRHAGLPPATWGHRSSCRPCAASPLRPRAGAQPTGSRSPRQAAPERATASWVRR